MPLLHITPSQVDVQLSGTLSRMTQNLLEDGGGATGLDPERPSGVAEEVGERVWVGHEGKKKPNLEGDSASSKTISFVPPRTQLLLG